MTRTLVQSQDQDTERNSMTNQSSDEGNHRTIREAINAWLDQPTKRRSFLGPWIGITVSIVLSLGLLSYQSEARARDACLSRATGREDIKLVLSGMVLKMADPAEQDQLLELVNGAIESIDPNTCPDPKVLFLF